MFIAHVTTLVSLLFNYFPNEYYGYRACLGIRYGEPYYIQSCMSDTIPNIIVKDTYIGGIDRGKPYYFLNGEKILLPIPHTK